MTNKYLMNGYGGFSGEDIAAIRIKARKNLDAHMKVARIKKDMNRTMFLSSFMF